MRHIIKTVFAATAIAAATTVALAGAASAMTIWVLNGFEFADGAGGSNAVIGAFEYDSVSGTYGRIAILTPNGVDSDGKFMAGSLYRFPGQNLYSTEFDTTVVASDPVQGAAGLKAFYAFWGSRAENASAGTVIPVDITGWGPKRWFEGTCDGSFFCNEWNYSEQGRALLPDANPRLIAVNDTEIFRQFEPPAVPLPASIGFLVAGFGALGLMRARRKA